MKEQDSLIELVLSFITKPTDMLVGMSVREAFTAAQKMINDHGKIKFYYINIYNSNNIKC